MKLIPYVPTKQAVNLYGVPMTGELPNGTESPVMIDQLNFLLERHVEKPFVGDLIGFEAIDFYEDARADILRQKDTAEAQGGWLVEDARAEAYRRACAKFQPMPSIAHNYRECMHAVRDMTSVTPKA